MNKLLFILLILISSLCPLKSESQIADSNSRIKVKLDSIFSGFSAYSFLAKEYLSADDADENLVIFHKRHESPFSNSQVFIGFIVLFAIILFIRLASPEYFRDLFLFAINGNYLLANHHKRNDFLLINNILLDGVFIVILSVLFFNLFSGYIPLRLEELFIGITLFIVAQIVLVFISYRTFFSSAIFNIHLTNLLVFNRVLGIILTPAVFIASYLNDAYQYIFLTILFFLVVLIVVFRVFRVYFLIKRSYDFNSIYIILYLCVFEISLYLLIIREFSWITNLKL